MTDPARPRPLSRLFGAAGGRRAAWRLGVLRRSAAALLVGMAATIGLGMLRPPSANPHSQVVVVAARPIAAGSVISHGDLSALAYPQALVPAGSVSDVGGLVGRTAAGPVGVGELITAGRLVDRALLIGLPAGTLALPVTASPESSTLVQAGRRVDGFVPGHAGPVVRDALVLAVSRVPAGALGEGEPALRVVLAVTAAQGSAVFAGLDPASPGSTLTFAVR